MRDLRALPKAEIHIHMEGAMRIGTVLELADRNGVPAPSGLTEAGWRFAGSEDFIAQYIAVCGLMTRLEDFRRLGEEVGEDLAANGVRYAEAVFTPSAHAATMNGDWFGPIEALLDGLAMAERATGTTVRLTPDVVRDAGLDAGRRTLEVARRFAGRGVVALNCAGSEVAPIAPFAPLFLEAKEAGLGSVPHAGEWAGPNSVWETLEQYAPDRIGHGIRAIDDPRLVDTLAERRIALEISPLSNVATGVYRSLSDHPFLPLRAAGVVVTLNSDDPPMFGGAWLTTVYEAAREAWGLTDEELAAIATTGVEVSFADEQRKAGLVGEIEAWLVAPDA
jgi:adenosine deaminase